MLSAIQNGIEYFKKDKPCRKHKNIAKDKTVVANICKKCGYPLCIDDTKHIEEKPCPLENIFKRNGRQFLGVMCEDIDGVIIKGGYLMKIYKD